MFFNIQAPDFAKIYAFLGTLFDPNETDHTEKLNAMNPTDRDVVFALMQNLAINLTNRQFVDQHRLIMEQYRLLANEVKPALSPGNSNSPSNVQRNDNSPSTTVVTPTEKESPATEDESSKSPIEQPAPIDSTTPLKSAKVSPFYSDTEFLVKKEKLEN